ncbi:flavin reductase family protein [Actinomadura fibrosa]|uniref:Flavin reductase family protein n=1 Tax=Actinomadura fibrosa TaxID=111802 RepID=A0ABW2XWW0_9ACTN|nr:flavin reductase family protein [Actinomadura fibrosa]
MTHADGPAGPTRSAFRRVMGAFPTGVTVLAAMAGPSPRGMTANAVLSLSLDPMLVLAAVRRDGRFAATLAGARGFSVNVLAEQQREVADWFASPLRHRRADEFAAVGWRRSPRTGAPLLDGVAAHLDCRVDDLRPGGDHVVLVGEVLDCAADHDRDPLVWFAGGYCGLDRVGGRRAAGGH